jgi:hypothetical protein
MRACVICNDALKWIKFKCAEGYVCKSCYEKASVNFTQTIKTKTNAELLELFVDTTDAQAEPTFTMTRKINQLIFFDDTSGKICLPNHKKYAKEKLKPEIYSYAEIVNCQLLEEHEEKYVKKKLQQLGRIKVVLTLKQETREIFLIPNYINRDSMAYKTMHSLANNIVSEVKKTTERIPC